MTPSTAWAAVLITSAGCYALKLMGMSVPERVLGRPVVRRIAAFLPIALLAALVAVQTFSVGQHLEIDARAAGVGAAVIAIWLKAPFIVVVVVAAATAALIRAVAH